MISEYNLYCQSLDGGMNSILIANQKALKVKQILKGCDIYNSVHIVSRHMENTLNKWFFNYSQEKCPGSAVTYISVLINFLSFLYHKFKKITFEQKSIMVEKLNKWQKAVNKLHQGAKTAKKNKY